MMVYNGQLDCQVRMWWPHSLVSSLQLHNIMTWHMHAFFQNYQKKKNRLTSHGSGVYHIADSSK